MKVNLEIVLPAWWNNFTYGYTVWLTRDMFVCLTGKGYTTYDAAKAACYAAIAKNGYTFNLLPY